MIKHIITVLFIGIYSLALSQYSFTPQKEIQCTPIKSQDRTGTCWSFATSSFLESEIIKKTGSQIDISEMFIVRNIYLDKARNYVLRQGKANFSQGSLSHDLIRIMAKDGIVPETAFTGKYPNEKKHNHSELEAGLKGFLDGVISQKKISPKWPKAVNAVLEVYLGKAPEKFTYDGKSHTPLSFAKHIDLSPDNYISLSSFTHHPFYSKFILEIPDNYSNGSYYNVPLDELLTTINNAIDNGYSIAWDGDVSEKSFSAKEGIAILPTDDSRKDLFAAPGSEIKVNQENRQLAFESFETTDDHLMHIVGTAKDQKGNKYYIIKNSWGEISPYKGYLYMSEAYLKMKTVGIMINKDAIPKTTSNKLFVNR